MFGRNPVITKHIVQMPVIERIVDIALQRRQIEVIADESLRVEFTGFQFDHNDVDDASGHPVFEDAFLKYLSDLSFSCDIDALPEGS